MKYTPKEITEEVNVTKVHPLVNLASLLGTTIVVSAAIYLGLGFVAGQLATRMDPETEIKIGQSLFPTGISHREHSQQLEYVEGLLGSLQQEMGATRIPLTVHLWENEQLNAAIFPGGNIVVTTGLLEAVETENELAFVLAHELGHFAARDTLKALGRSLVFVFVSTAIDSQGGASGVVSTTGQLTNLHYSRTQESAADLYALEAIIRRYQHGGYSLDFFARIKAKDTKGKLSEYFSTHPITQDRIDELKTIAAARGWSMTGVASPIPETVTSSDHLP
ncbi:MAG: M48 family metalloprotease [Prochloron sp. SP5CPC1]|nr:M48 family metalloprotease [Candidatus Paraprochloron terpiosi SP5CPC1]